MVPCQVRCRLPRHGVQFHPCLTTAHGWCHPAGLFDVVLDQGLMTQTMRRHPQVLARDAEARHHIVEAPQVFHETAARVTHVSIRPLRDALRELQRCDALQRIQRHEARPAALGTLLDPNVFVGLVLRQESPRWLEIEALADSQPGDFSEFVQVFRIFKQAHQLRLDEVEHLREPLAKLTPLGLLAYTSLYAFEQLRRRYPLHATR